MRIAVFGDITSDNKRLKKLFDISRGQAIDLYVCTGDIAHHKPCSGDIDTCVRMLKEHEVRAASGNHDKKLVDSPPDFASSETIAHLAELPERLELGGAFFSHESPSGRYNLMMNRKEFDFMQENLPARIAFYGHTHKRVHFQRTESGVCIADYFPRFNRDYDISSGLHIINPGTVHRTKPPFGFNERAGYAILDTKTQVLQFRENC